MAAPKISVIIPMYNRKHYIAQAIDSVLGQTFQDFELIVRDDGSTDGSADFVAERYATEISSGKIKLRRNEKNIGEFPTDNRMLREATGKYIMILHSDDMYLPNALEHMHAVAEHFQADVVHSTVHLGTPPDGVIKKGTPLRIVYHDKNRVDKVTVMSDNLLDRFNERVNGGTFVDIQYNILRREFLAENDVRFESFTGNGFFLLKCLMRAKVFVKTPQPFYIYRSSPDSQTSSKFPPERVTKFIENHICQLRRLDEFFAKDEFFRDNTELQYRVKSELLFNNDRYRFLRNDVYKDGITPELHRAVEEAFKKYFGADAAYPTFLFHWVHCLQSNKSVNQISPPQR